MQFVLNFSFFSHYPSSNGATVVMSSMGCYGGESSIFMCRNPGWQKNIDERCYEANRNAGVFCYNNGTVKHWTHHFYQQGNTNLLFCSIGWCRTMWIRALPKFRIVILDMQLLSKLLSCGNKLLTYSTSSFIIRYFKS